MTALEAPHAPHEWVVDVATRRVVKRTCPTCESAVLAVSL